MGVCIAPYIVQERIIALMEDLWFVINYLGDLLVITLGSSEEQLSKVDSNCLVSNTRFISASSHNPK